MKPDVHGISERQIGASAVMFVGLVLVPFGIAALSLAPQVEAASRVLEVGGLGVAVVGVAMVWATRRPPVCEVRIDAVGVHLTYDGRRVEHVPGDQVRVTLHRLLDGRQGLRLELPGGRGRLLGVGAPEKELRSALEALEAMWSSRAVGTTDDIPDALSRLMAARDAER